MRSRQELTCFVDVKRLKHVVGDYIPLRAHLLYFIPFMYA